mgnify:CR=1 FL=1
MKIKKLIELLETMYVYNDEEEVEIDVEDGDIMIINDVYVGCNFFGGSGIVGREVLSDRSRGYCRDGEMREPIYDEIEEDCPECNGDGVVRMDNRLSICKLFSKRR